MIALTHPERVMWPEAGWTKADLAAYWRAIAPVILPHLAGRAITLGRFPEGVHGRGFYQTNCPRGAPPSVRTVSFVSPAGKPLTMCLVEDEATLAWVANLGTIELHPFLAPAATPDAPRAIVFDLDPGAPAGLLDAARVAREVRARLEARGLAAFAKVSGAKGVHVHVPVGGATFAETKAFARAIAAELVAADPARVTDRMPKAGRAGKVFVDWGQNDPMKSTIAPYSLRAMPVPLVAAPVDWEELAAAAAPRELRFTPAQALARVAERGDRFAPLLELAQRVPG